MKRAPAISALCLTMALFTGVAASMTESYYLHPVGTVVKSGGQTALVISPPYRQALLGLKDFSHVIVLYWFDRNDSPAKRKTLRVHPRRDKRNPLTGVFATHAPVRPNLIGLSVCRIESVEDGRVIVDEIDAFDRTPILDLKPYIPASSCVPGASTPTWVKRNRGD